MKHWALSLCLLAPFAGATEKNVEEVVVKARRVTIELAKLEETHKQSPWTGEWYYVEEKKQDKEDEE